MEKLVINAVEKYKEGEIVSNRASANSCGSEKIVKTVSEEQSRVITSKDTVIPRECERSDRHANKDQERSGSNCSTCTHEIANQEAGGEVINAKLDDQLKRAAGKFANKLFASRGDNSNQPREQKDKSVNLDQQSGSSNRVEREKDNAEGSAHEQRDGDEIATMMSENRCFLSISLGGRDYKALFDPGNTQEQRRGRNKIGLSRLGCFFTRVPFYYSGNVFHWTSSGNCVNLVDHHYKF